MSYTSKRTIVSMIAGIVSVAAYIIHTVFEDLPARDNIKAWAVRLLIFIGISAAAQIIVIIMFHIGHAIGIVVKKGDDKDVERIISSEAVEDERSILISLKSYYIGYISAGVGFGAGLIALALGLPVVAALHIITGMFAAGSVFEGAASIYFHERGIRHG